MATTSKISADYDTMAIQLKVLSDPQRLRIMDLLMSGVQCNCEIGNHLDLAPNLISHHLGVLRRSGLVIAERDQVDARWIYYSVNDKVLGQLSEVFGHFFNPARIQPRRPDCGPRVLRLET